ncbi:MAG: phenylalanine--tRNA ligase subunit beta [Marinicellaceae bacterium]
MKISEKWLREWVNPSVSSDELVEQLTMLGLEVDDVLPAAGEFTEVVVAKIVALEKHPDADKLNVCQVDIGCEENLQIVCGAPNARVGLVAPLAKIGAVLPGNFKIKKSKLRGMESFGMLCSNVELGLSDDHSGLLELPNNAPIGKDIREYFQLDDNIIDIDLTPNRADCFSLKGIAIDVACLNDLKIKSVEPKEVEISHNEHIEVKLSADKQCPRYLCRVINNIDNTKETPIWMQEKLRRSGIRSIHPVVDVTNYVMLEFGQPMHGFDKTTIKGAINVKMAKKDDKITLLDGKEITLNDSFLMIADEINYLAIAGIMGGENSGVTESTKNIVLESAYFDPATIMGKSRDIGVHTESALRFERGVDSQLQTQAMHRATELIIDICGGEVGPINEAKEEKYLPKQKNITLSKEKLKRVLGFEVPSQQVTDILTGLSMQVETQENTWQIKAPSSRFDIAIEEDLIEEVVRMVGYDKMPSENLVGQSVIIQLPEEHISHNNIKNQLCNLGYLEAINYSFVSEKLLNEFNMQEDSFALKNPLTEEFSIMRTSLLPGMMQTLNYNLRRQHDSIKMFETGNVFHKKTRVTEDDKIIAICTGIRNTEHWGMEKEKLDFFDCKGDLEKLLDSSKMNYDFTLSEYDFLHPGRQAQVCLKGELVGWIGQVHPEICRRMGIKKEVYAFELFMKKIQNSSLPSYETISKYPSVRRDLAMVIDAEVSYQNIANLIYNELGENLVDTIVFDEYKGDSIGKDKRSLAVGLVLQQKNATFEDKDVDKLIAKVVSSISEKLSIEIRGN